MNGCAKGIDVSEHNGVIDWEKARTSGIAFAMLRAGYGMTVDKRFVRNASECGRLGIPFGVYWFSYALSPAGAEREAAVCLETIRPYPPGLPVAFDFEYDSVNYAQKKGVCVSAALASDMALSFCRAVRDAGYPAMNYANPDFLNRYFNTGILEGFPLWLAQWPGGTPILDKPPRPCGLWQYSDKGSIPGISGPVDLDVCYLDALKKKTDIPEGEEMRYNKIADMPAYAQPVITRMVDQGLLRGAGPARDENDRPADLDLSLDMIRVFVANDRAGLYGEPAPCGTQV